MKDLVKLLTVFDWITPAVGLVEDIANDPTLMRENSWTFFIPFDQSIDSGFNPNDVKRLLKQNNIKTWGWQYTLLDPSAPNEYMFSVKLWSNEL